MTNKNLMEKSWSIHQLISITLGNLTLQASDGENVRLHWDKDEKTKTEVKELLLEGSIDGSGVKMRFTVRGEGMNAEMYFI